MNFISKKNNVIFFIVSAFFLVIGTILVLFSNNLLYFLQDFFENKIYHRAFDISKWADTINALLAFPLFITIFFDALIFIKCDDKTKIYYIFMYFTFILICFVYCAFTRHIQIMDSDMASEMLLAQECNLKKSFWPLSWYYSTEIRLLNSQLLTAPLFLFTKNWFVIKPLSALFVCIVYVLSFYFLISQFKIEKKWLILLGCLLIFSPWSMKLWDFSNFGNYYIPHIIMAFIYTGLFFYLSYGNLSEKKYLLFTIIFYLFAFISGFSTIRYILFYTLPLAITLCGYTIGDIVKNKITFNSIKQFYSNYKICSISIIGLFISGFGYLINTFILSKFYSFSEFNTTKFGTLGDVKLITVINDIFELIGYKNEISILTPSGIIDIFIILGITLFIISIISFFKTSEITKEKVFISFYVVMFVFYSFFIINTNYLNRYLILPIGFFIPALIILINYKKLNIIKRYFLCFIFSIILITSTFITFTGVLTTDKNKDKYSVEKFLENNNFEFGYATFWNANVFTYLSNGKIEIANLEKNIIDDKVYLTENLDFDKWLSPERYYDESYKNNIKVFLLVTEEEYQLSSNHNLFKNGILEYYDDFYRVYTYSNKEDFKNAYIN